MKKIEYKQIDMTKGNILSSIISFSIPLLVSSLFQTFYNTVDSIVLGNFVSTEALAAVGACESPMLVLLMVLTGLSSGISVVISQGFGTGDKDQVKKVVATANRFFLLSVIPLTVCMLLLTKPLLSFIDIQDSARDYAFQYLIIILGAMIGSYGYNLNSGILRGLGDSRSPLLFLIVSCVVNIVLDLFFVLVLNWGVVGVAIATVTAQIVSWLYSLWHIKRHFKDLDFRLFSLQIDRAILKRFLSIGLPMVINQSIFSLGFLIYYRFVNQFGTVFMAGYSVAGKVQNFTWLPISSLGTAAVTFAGQNSGAGNLDWLKKGVKILLKTSLIINVATSIITILLGNQLLGIFTSDTAVIEAGYYYILCLSPFYWMYTIIHILICFMNGVGDVKVSTFINLLMFWGVRLPVAWYMSLHFSGNLLHLSYPISWVVACIMTIIYYKAGRWKRGIPTTKVSDNTDNADTDDTDSGYTEEIKILESSDISS